MNTTPVSVIVNPAASGGRGEKAVPGLVAALEAAGVPFRLARTAAPGDARRLARQAWRDGASRILAVGGDGTVHEVADGLIGGAGDLVPGHAPPPVVVCPVGTGNDFYHMVGARRAGRDIRAVVDLVEHGTVEHLDVGRVTTDNGERTFVNLFGVGVDTAVLRCRSRYSWLPGLPQYLAAFLNAAVTFRPPNIVAEIVRAGDPSDSLRLGGPVTLLVVTVGPSIGGGFMINPDAEPSDGKLDLCRISSLNWRQIGELVPKVVRGTHASSELVTMRPVEQVVIREASGQPLAYELDGELVSEPSAELTVRVLPGAFPVVVPKAAKPAKGEAS